MMGRRPLSIFSHSVHVSHTRKTETFTSDMDNMGNMDKQTLNPVRTRNRVVHVSVRISLPKYGQHGQELAYRGGIE